MPPANLTVVRVGAQDRGKYTAVEANSGGKVAAVGVGINGD